MKNGEFQRKLGVIRAGLEATDWSEGDKKALGQSMKSVLRAVAKACGLRVGEFDVRYNPGGTASKGDAVLHCDDLYVSIDPDSAGPGVLVRNCNGRKDYSGGANGWMPWKDFLEAAGAEDIAQRMRAIAPPLQYGAGGGLGGPVRGAATPPERRAGIA